MSMPQSYFLTGGAGFLGKVLLKHILESQSNALVYCLVRPKQWISAQDRIAKILCDLGCQQAAGRVIVLAGDLAAPHFDLSQQEYHDLTCKITHILHCAAKVDFVAPESVMQRENITTTQNIIQFAQDCQQHNPIFQTLGYVSTAYVAGKRTDLVSENDFSDQAGFNNIYESTKFSAEQSIRLAAKHLPIIIFRPSIIIGSSQKNLVDKSNVLYPLLRCAQQYPYMMIPANNALLDCVPVDFVAHAICALINTPETTGKTFHLTAGTGQELSIDTMIQTANQILKIHLRRIPMFTFNLGKPLIEKFLPQNVIRTFKAYYPYLRQNPRFCTKISRVWLEKHNISCPKLQSILEKTLYDLSNIKEKLYLKSI